MTTLRSMAALAILFAVGCAPTAQDEAMMQRMMAYEAGQADIIEKNLPNCTKVETELKAYATANKASHQEISAWWDALGKGKRQKLSEKSKGGTYRLPMAMMKGTPACTAHMKRGFKAD